MRTQRATNRLAYSITYLAILIAILVFIFYPYAAILTQALTKGGTNYLLFIQHNLTLLWHSLFVAILTTVLSLITTLALTILQLFLKHHWRQVLRLILLVTMVAPPFVTSLAYINLFGRRGLITYGLLHLTFNPYGPQGIILMQTVSFSSLNALLLISIIQKVDPGLINSARSLGATPTRILLDIILPAIKPGIMVVALVSFIRSLADFQTPTIIGGSYQVLSSAGYYAMISLGNLHLAALINITLAIPAVIGFFIYIHYNRSLTMLQHGLADNQMMSILPKSGAFWHCSLSVSILFYLVLILQYGSIFINAITERQLGHYHLSLQPLRQTAFFISPEIIGRTIAYSIVAGFIGSLISFLIVYYHQVHHSHLMKLVEMVGTLPYILPGTFFGLGYLYAFSEKPLVMTGTSAIVIINLIFKQVAFATKAANAVVSQLPTTYFKIIHDLGGATIAEWQDVFFPLTRRGFALTFLNGFISTMTTIGSIIFLVHPGQELLTLVMFDVVQQNEYQVASVIACLIILICLAVAGIVMTMVWFAERKHSHVL